MNPFGGVAGGVGNNLMELGKSAVKGVQDAGKNIAKDTLKQLVEAPQQVAVASIENTIGSKAPANPQQQDKQAEAQQKTQKDQERKSKAKRRMEEVRGELAEFVKHQQQIEARKKQEEEQQKAQQKQVEEQQKKESFAQLLMKRVKGQSHGEMAKQKE